MIIDKYTFFMCREKIENAFKQSDVDIRNVYFAGRFLYDDVARVITIRALKDVTQNAMENLAILLEEEDIFPQDTKIEVEVRKSEEKYIREISWEKLLAFGTKMENAAVMILNNLEQLYELVEKLSSQDIPNVKYLSAFMLINEISSETLCCMIDIGYNYFECIGERLYMRNNIYRALDLKTCNDEAGHQKYEKAIKVLEYSMNWGPHYAADNNKIINMQKILKLGKANLNEDRDKNGKLCLHRAVFSHHKKMVKLLLEHGADPRSTDHRCGDSFDYIPSYYSSNSQIKEILEKQVKLLEEKENTPCKCCGR